MYFYQPKYNIIRLINKWMLNERWVQGELFVNTGECTVSANREKWRAQVNALWVHEKMGELNFLYLYHGSIGQYHFNNETSFLLPGWIMGLEKWWYWQTFKFKRQLMSLCMLKYHRSQQYCKVAPKKWFAYNCVHFSTNLCTVTAYMWHYFVRISSIRQLLKNNWNVYNV